MDLWDDIEAGVEPEMALRRTFPLVACPPPCALFMRATGEDLSVFGEELEDGSLQMIDQESIAEYMHHENLARLVEHRPIKLAAVALANKMARMAWVIMARGERYREPAELAT